MPENPESLTPVERREAKRAALLAQKDRERKMERIGTIGGYIVVFVIAALLAAVISGALAWLAVWLWTNLPF